MAATTASAQWGYYAAPVVGPVPTVTYYAPPATYYAPAPTVTYYAPAPTYAYYAPVVVPRRYYAAYPLVYPAPVYVAPRVFVPGQPVRNTLRAVFP